MRILVKNANVITPYEILKNYSVAIEKNTIINIDKSNSFKDRDFDLVVSCDGRYLSPGFIDIHNHGNYGHDTMEATIEALDSMASFHLKNGVTGFLPTTITAPYEGIKRAIKNVAEYIKLQEYIKQKERLKSQVLGLHLEGPYFSEVKKGAQPLEFIKNPDIKEIDELINISNNNIKIVSLAPELKGAGEMIEHLKNKGITASAGHSNAKFEEAKASVDRGVTLATHLYNGMRSFSHRDPSIIGAVLIDERVRCEMICDGVHIHPGAMKLAAKIKGKDGIVLISDATMAAGLEDGEYELGGRKVFVKNGEVRLPEGNLAGSTLTLNRSVCNMVNMVGIPLQDAVRMASLNPAKAIGVSNNKGSIEIGKDADMIIFDENINVSSVIVYGNIVEI